MRLIGLLPRVIAILAVIAVSLSLIVYYFSEPIADAVATKAFVHSPIPGDYELPPTAHAISYSARDIQIIGGQGYGLNCSIEPFLEDLIFGRENREIIDFPRNADGFVYPRKAKIGWLGHPPDTRFKISMKRDSVATQMRQACVYHDYCYRHGSATYGYSQADCDYILLNHAFRLCRFTETSLGHDKCVNRARKVVLGVRMMGGDFFKTADHEIQPTKERRQDHWKKSCKKGDCTEPIRSWFDDDLTSSYFEFDPYPVLASHYRVFRLADAPRAWRNMGVYQKALYIFEMKPTGMHIRIEGYYHVDAYPVCVTHYFLSAKFHHLNLAPQVVRARDGNGNFADWFIWWQRRNLDQTGGHIDLLKTGMADATAWRKLFPGAAGIKRDACAFHEEFVADDLDNIRLPQQKLPDAYSVYVGHRKSFDDPFATELHTLPGLEKDQSIRFMTVRSEPCGRGSAICYTDFVIDPKRFSGSTSRQFLKYDTEPRSVWDRYNHKSHKNPPAKRHYRITRRETLRYRNYVLPPIHLGIPEDPVFAWFTRGTHNDLGHAESVLLRRASNIGTGSKSSGIVKLIGLQERMEPVVVASRSDKNADLVSVYREITDTEVLTSEFTDTPNPSTIAMKAWRLPDKFEEPTIELGDNCAKKYSDPITRASRENCRYRRELALAEKIKAQGLVHCFQHRNSSGNRESKSAACLAKPVQAKPFNTSKCPLVGTHGNWLNRPPIVVNLDPAATAKDFRQAILFTRLWAEWPADRAERGQNLALQYFWALLRSDGTCRLTEQAEMPLSMPAPIFANNGHKEFVKWQASQPSKYLAILRSTPMIAGDIDADGNIDLIAPFGRRYYRHAPGAKRTGAYSRIIRGTLAIKQLR